MTLLEYNGVNFWDGNVWKIIIQLAIILVAILLSNAIRRKVKFINKSLLPSSVIAGLLIFVLKFIPAISNLIDTQFMEIITYHALGIGFIALSLKTGVKAKNKNKAVIVDSGIITVNGYLVQAAVGLIISLIFFSIGGFFFAAGLLLPMGYGQGTGQALNFGKVYEGMGFTNGTAFGLSIAAVGFLFACMVGVVYLNILKRKGKLKLQENRKDEANEMKENVYQEDEAPLSESVDKLTIQLGFIFAVYIITYLVIFGLSWLSEEFLGNFGTNTLKPLFWGFNFLFGSLFAILIKKILAILTSKKIIKYRYINNHIMSRVSGLFFDVMIVAGIAAIDWQDMSGLLLPLLLMCSIGGILTFLYIRFVCHKIYPEYPYEAFFSIFGMLTGTASTGMILLREIDPNYETPAANNLVLQQLPAIIFGAPLLLLMTFAGQSVTNCLIVLGIVLAMLLVYNIILFRKKIFRRRKKNVDNVLALEEKCDEILEEEKEELTD
ncbi:MAG: hypothetical protein E7176_03305 [Erysipelotrichaceae bacterium]|nr:hypothetical protein [Erysipelotrichaceae bacterium]